MISPPGWVLVCNAGPAGPRRSARAHCVASSRRARPGPWWDHASSTRTATVYPSVRRFPVLHRRRRPCAFGALVNPENRFTKRYNPGAPEGDVVAEAGWISGSCFLARRAALEELGGFDEAYFMYAEDMDLCWRAHRAGWGIGFAGAASITHIARSEHGPASLQDDGGPPSLGSSIHRSHHLGMAPGRPARWPSSSWACASSWPRCAWPPRTSRHAAVPWPWPSSWWLSSSPDALAAAEEQPPSTWNRTSTSRCRRPPPVVGEPPHWRVERPASPSR